MNKKILILFLSILLSSCIQLSLEDVSNHPDYRRVLGKKFSLVEELWATGVTTDKNYKKQIDYIILVPGVGFFGPEVVIRDRLKKGTVIKIAKVLKSTSLFSNKIVYIVELPDKKYSDFQVRIKVSGSIDAENYGLNSSIFSKI